MKDYRRYVTHPPKEGKRGVPPVANRKKVEKKPRPPFPWKRLFRTIGITARLAAIPLLIGALSYGGSCVASRLVFMPLEKIEIRGRLEHLSREQVALLLGVRRGESILSLKIGRMGETISKNPWVSHVRIRRYFPGTLLVEIQERAPVAVVNLGYLYYLDSTGEIFKPVSSGEPMDFPVITGFAESDLTLDRKSVQEHFRTVLTLMEELRKSGVMSLDEVSEIHYDKGNGFTIYALRGGVPIRLGHDSFSPKLARLGRIYRQLHAGSSPPLFIDLDYPDRIIVRRS